VLRRSSASFASFSLPDAPRRPSTPLKKGAAITASAIARLQASTVWENRWSQRSLVDQNPEGLSERTKATLTKAEAMTLADYRAADRPLLLGICAALVRRSARQAARTAPNRRSGIQPSELVVVRPPVSVPLLAVGGMPFGVQLMEWAGCDGTIAPGNRVTRPCRTASRCASSTRGWGGWARHGQHQEGEAREHQIDPEQKTQDR
jgi:hypothetical protein